MSVKAYGLDSHHILYLSVVCKLNRNMIHLCYRDAENFEFESEYENEFKRTIDLKLLGISSYGIDSN